MAGTADHETKFAEAQNIFTSAAEPKTFVVFEGARHQDYLQFDSVKYQATILNFLAANLK
jgi:alpha-beta hydrolase superfamily lysophospholipase